MSSTASSKETIAIIPARGGSKGIKKKNLQLIGKMPLIAYSIIAALSSKLITRVVVSTDDKDIAEVSREYGAEVPFMRPASLAGDLSLIGDAEKHMLDALQACEHYDPDIVAVMLPSHPFRPPELIDVLLSYIEQGYKSVITVRHISLVEHSWYTLKQDGTVRSIKSDNEKDAPFAMRPYGLFYAHSRRLAPLGTYVYPLTEPEQLIDIDDPEDLALAQNIVKNRFGCNWSD